MRRIVFTRPGGGVMVTTPTDWCMSMLSSGGFWRGKSRGWLEEQEERQIAAGHLPSAVRRYMRAMQAGGCTTAEAYDIVRDRDCGHLGSGFDLCRPQDLPGRWFRNAWRRSPNGGPIRIDLDAARHIQLEKIGRAIDAENARRRKWSSRERPIRVNRGAILDRISLAETPEDLRRVWPDGLPSKLVL